MNKDKLREKPWYNTAAAICIGVVLYVVLTRLDSIFGAAKTFVGYFAPVLTGCLIAYLVNPLAQFYGNSLFRRAKTDKGRAMPANILAFVTVILFIMVLLLVLIPQLAESIHTFANNLDGYIASAEQLINRLGILEKLGVSIDSLSEESRNIVKTVGNYLVNNISNIVTSSASAGKALFQFIIGFILSVYILADKSSLRRGGKRLMKGVFKPARYDGLAAFLRRCDEILRNYIVYNLLDSVIVGVVNAVFMVIAGMPYAGLVSFVVAVTNLVPTFGPVVGAVIGAFVLVLVKPWYALAFLIFTLVLQTCDGYLIKPKLFGSSLGVSGLWILIGVIVGGRMFGAVGMLAAIPAVAILDYIYNDLFLKWLEKKRTAADAPSAR